MAVTMLVLAVRSWGRAVDAAPLCPRAAVAGLGSGRGSSRRARVVPGNRRAWAPFGFIFYFYFFPIFFSFPFLILGWAAWNRLAQRIAGSRQK